MRAHPPAIAPDTQPPPNAYPASLRPAESSTAAYAAAYAANVESLTTGDTDMELSVRAGSWSTLRLIGVLEKADPNTTTLTLTLSSQSGAGSSTQVATQDVTITGAGPDTWVAVNATFDAPAAGIYLLTASLSSSTATLHGPVVSVEG